MDSEWKGRESCCRRRFALSAPGESEPQVSFLGIANRSITVVSPPPLPPLITATFISVILYLAACGVGKLTVVDFDGVEISNLHRQVIHKTRDVGMNKAQSAAKAVYDLNPTIRCETVECPLTSSNALEIISNHDCVVDASDNPQTRYLINDACVLAGVPLVSGSAIGVEGQLTVYNYNDGPCYRCLYPNSDSKEGSKSCSDNGVLGPVPGLIGILQAVETIKVLTGVG